MEMILLIPYFILPIVFGLQRTMHGSGMVGRAESILTLIFPAILITTKDPLLSIVLTLAILFGYSFGWGKYFGMIDGTTFKRLEVEFLPADYVSNYVFDRTRDHKLSSVIGMSIRWFVAFLPAFLILNTILMAIPLLLIGIIYLLHNKHNSWYLTEYSTGMLLGLLISTSILIFL